MYYFDFTEQCWHQVHYDMQRCMAIPTPRASHSIVYFPRSGTQGCFYMFGGGNFHQFFNDVFLFDIANRTWLMPAVSGEGPPPPRAGHTATKIDDSNFCIIGGGEPTTVFNDIYVFNIDRHTWIKVNAAGYQPERRCGHSASLFDRKIILFGGGDVDG